MKRSMFNGGRARAAGAGLVLTLAGGLGLVALACAQDGVPPPPAGRATMPPGPGMPMPMPMSDALPPFDGLWHGRLPAALKLSDAQRGMLRQIAEATRADLQKQRAAHRALGEQWEALLGAPRIDAQAAEALRARMEAAHEATSRRLLQATLEAAAVLTPEQRAHLVSQWKARRAEGWHGHPGGWGAGHGPRHGQDAPDMPMPPAPPGSGADSAAPAGR